MTKKLSDKLGDVFVTTNPQSSGLAGETIYYSGDTSGWEVIGGVTQQDGWALCDGAEVTQAEYPDLFEAIGTAWNFGGETGFRLPTIPDVAGNPTNAVAIIALYNNVASVVSTRDLSVNKLSIDTDLAVGTSATIPDLTVTGTLTADAVVSNSGETVSDILGEVKASVLTEAQFQSLKGTGWVLAHGQSLDRTLYADLFNLIGTTYGADDSATFKLPDLKERYIRGASGEGITSNDLGASNSDTTSVANVGVVTHSETKSFSGAQTTNDVGAQGINANINSTNSNNVGGVNVPTGSGNQHFHSSGNYHYEMRDITSNNVNNIAPGTFLPNVGNTLNNRANYLGVSVTPNGAAYAFPLNVNTANNTANWSGVSYTDNAYVDIKGNTGNESSHTHNVNIDHDHGITVTNVQAHGHNDITGNVDINHGHNLTGDTETAPKSVVLNYFIKIA